MQPDVDLVAAITTSNKTVLVSQLLEDPLATCATARCCLALVDYRFAKRFDVYFGAMYSQVSTASPAAPQQIHHDPTTDLRFQFYARDAPSIRAVSISEGAIFHAQT